jgi:hypothetical protein
MAMPLLQESKQGKPKRGLRITSMASLMLKRVADKPDEPVEWPLEIRHALDALTYKQRHFSICVACGMRNVDAYKRAYDVAEDRDPDTLYTDASILCSHPKVANAISIMSTWLDREWLMESKEVIEYGYHRLYEEAEYASKSSDRIRAATNLLKAHGAFVSRSEVRHIHTLDSDVTQSLVEGIAALLSTPEPKVPQQLTQANVASVEFTDSESTDS